MKHIKLFAASLLASIVGLVAYGQVVSALVPNDLPSDLRAELIRYDNICPGIPEKYGIYTWISPAGQPAQRSITVPYGTQDVPLQYNRLVFVCRDLVNQNGTTYPDMPRDGQMIRGSLTSNQSQVVGNFVADNGTLQNTGPLTALSTAYRSTSTRYWFPTEQTFTYRANSPLTSTQTIRVGFDAKQANVYSFSSLACIYPPGPAGFSRNLQNCNNISNLFTITINVAPPPPASAQGYFVVQDAGTPVAGTATIAGVGSSNNMPFTFGSIAPGTRALGGGSVPDGFVVLGSTICRNGGAQADVPACSPGNPSSSPGTAGWQAGGTRDVDWQAGANYEVRWIVRPALNCTVAVSPNLLDPLSEFTITGTASGAAASAAYAIGANQMTITISGPTTQTRVIDPATLSGNTITGSASFRPLGTPGSYTITVRLGGVFAGSACITQVRTVAYMPTFTGRNGDIVAGMTLPGTDTGACAAVDTSAGIAGWNQALSTTPGFIGSGGNLGAMALHAMQGYATGTEAAGGGGSGGGISFANSPSSEYSYTNDTGRFGGGFGSYATSCAPDYYAQRLTDVPTQAISGGSMSGWNGAYMGTGDVTLGGGTISEGDHVRVYVDGNVRITDDIVFSMTSAALRERSKIPSVWIIATGNIYIDPNVGELNGVFVAQGKSIDNDTGGFYSCITAANEFTSFVPGASRYDYARCSAKTLTVNGSVIAKRLVLTRSHGSIGATTNQTYAEIFNYSPLVWLSLSGIGGNATGSSELGNGYQSITGLPPVL
ncbi:MAG: hypothetical protein WBP26_04740 [Candidatus Saccharimonadales bacterium]